ncbi:MAG TPA: hypothetical protein VFI61_01310 [Patescibacteria group bacterium]|nr:hypothetical protein [Patescibacteria group bacterium]
MIRKTTLILIGIVFFGFLLRAYRITSLPMYGDELTMVYDTYSILKTGMDATGERMPLTFRMGAGRPGGYIYASIPFVSIFGPTELGIRSLSVLSGLGIIVLMFFLAKKLFDNEKIGLIASFLTSISMWDIYLSRGGFEAHFALLLALLGVTAFIYSKYLIWAIAWGLTIFTYPTFKLTLPIIFPLLIWFWEHKFGEHKFGVHKTIVKNKLFVASLIVLTLFGVLVIRESLKGRSEERFLSSNIFSDSGMKEQLIQKINDERNLSSLPKFIKPVFYNRPYEYFRIVSENYIDNLSPGFLFLRGDGNPRHNSGEWGMLYFIEFPILLVGIYKLWIEKKKDIIFLGGWILITPLATMLMGEPHALRSDFMLPPILLITSYTLSKFTRKQFYFIFGLMFLQLILILNAIYFLSPNKFASFWSADAKTESLKAINSSKKDKKVTLSTKIDNIEYAYEVYAKIDPNLVISQYGKFPKVFGSVLIVDK